MYKLPQHGRYWAAWYEDDEIVERVYDEMGAETEGPSKISVLGWDNHSYQLAAVTDQIKRVAAILEASNSKTGKAPKLKPEERPKTAFDRVRNRRAKEEHQQRVAALLPHKRKE